MDSLCLGGTVRTEKTCLKRRIFISTEENECRKENLEKVTDIGNVKKSIREETNEFITKATTIKASGEILDACQKTSEEIAQK